MERIKSGHLHLIQHFRSLLALYVRTYMYVCMYVKK